jgi:hypothetical protein
MILGAPAVVHPKKFRGDPRSRFTNVMAKSYVRPLRPRNSCASPLTWWIGSRADRRRRCGWQTRRCGVAGSAARRRGRARRSNCRLGLPRLVSTGLVRRPVARARRFQGLAHRSLDQGLVVLVAITRCAHCAGDELQRPPRHQGARGQRRAHFEPMDTEGVSLGAPPPVPPKKRLVSPWVKTDAFSC